MTNMANITVKKNDGTTDVIYTALVPSAGDKTPAIWKNQTVGTAMAHRPEMTLISRDNGNSSARRVYDKFTYPTLVTDAQGKVTVADKLIIETTAIIPKGMPDADVNEAISQHANLHASTLFKDSYKAGYAPT